MNHKTKIFDENSYCMLLKKSKNELLCDFCDETFNTRYWNIIHNAHHIVIPLLKQEFHQCKICLFHFQSHDELITHSVIKHNSAISVKKVKSIIHTTGAEEIELTHGSTTENLKVNNNNKVLQNIDLRDKHQQICSNGSVSKPKTSNVSGKEASNNRKIVCLNETPKLTVKKFKSENSQANVEKMTPNSDQHQLISKEVIVMNQCDYHIKSEEFILPDVIYDDKISNTNKVNPIVVVPVTKPYLKFDKTSNVCYVSDDGILIDHEIIISDYKPSQLKSIHYDELILESNLSCKYCHNDNVFPNRYCLILHQTSHLNIMNTRPNFCVVCNKYFTRKDYESHISYVHMNAVNSLKSCLMCGLEYLNYKKHLKQYHHHMFLWDGDWFFEHKKRAITYGNIIIQCNSTISNAESDVVRVCKCYMTMWKNVKYKRISTVRRRGYRLKCHECGKRVIEIYFVEKMSEPFKIEDILKKRSSHKTNEVRLKNIQSRMKMINKLSRY